MSSIPEIKSESSGRLRYLTVAVIVSIILIATLGFISYNASITHSTTTLVQYTTNVDQTYVTTSVAIQSTTLTLVNINNSNPSPPPQTTTSVPNTGPGRIVFLLSFQVPNGPQTIVAISGCNPSQNAFTTTVQVYVSFDQNCTVTLSAPPDSSSGVYRFVNNGNFSNGQPQITFTQQPFGTTLQYFPGNSYQFPTWNGVSDSIPFSSSQVNQLSNVTNFSVFPIFAMIVFVAVLLAVIGGFLKYSRSY